MYWKNLPCLFSWVLRGWKLEVQPWSCVSPTRLWLRTVDSYSAHVRQPLHTGSLVSFPLSGQMDYVSSISGMLAMRTQRQTLAGMYESISGKWLHHAILIFSSQRECEIPQLLELCGVGHAQKGRTFGVSCLDSWGCLRLKNQVLLARLAIFSSQTAMHVHTSLSQPETGPGCPYSPGDVGLRSVSVFQGKLSLAFWGI